MKPFALTVVAAIIVLSSFNSLAETGYVTHPSPADPVFLSKEEYLEIKKSLVPPPARGSSEQLKDQQTLINYQSHRSAADCRRANAEVHVDFKEFFGPGVGPLTESELIALIPFMDELDKDSYYFVEKLKQEFPRERPFVYLKELNPCVPKEKSLSYPSGHAAISALIALAVSELLPNKSVEMLKRADQIAENRVMSGVHHPSDIVAGKAVARYIFNMLQSSKKYRQAILATKERLDATSSNLNLK